MKRAWALAGALLFLAGCGSGSARVARSSPTTAGPTVTPAASTSTTSTTATTLAPATTVKPAPAPLATTTTVRQAVAAAGACPSNLASSVTNTYSARQLVTVEASGYGTDIATVTLWQKSGSCWQPAAGPWSGFIGYKGFTDRKQEGDGETPTGIYGFGPVIYGNAADPGVHEAYQPLDCGDWWDEDSSSPTYNTFQDLSCSDTNPPFDNGSSERLWEEQQAYPSFAVIDYNTGPVVKGAGSAIFFHASLGHGTAGCVSVPPGDLDWFLRWMLPSQDPLIVMGPASEITRF